METIPPPSQRRRGTLARRLASLALIAWGVGGVEIAAGHSGILFARDAAVPQSVGRFAWRVIETRCNYQSYELAQRSFWAYAAHFEKVGADVIYSLGILSDLTWKKTQPPAIIEMTIVDNGQLALTGLRSTYVTCSAN